MPERLPPKPATSADQIDLFGNPRKQPAEAPKPAAPPALVERQPWPAGPPQNAQPRTAEARPVDRARVYSVRELNREIKGVLGGRFLDIRVRGEI